jgi:hypothetical protein
MFESDIGVLRFDPPDSGPLWDVHHKTGMCITSIFNGPAGVNAKMDNADSAFPRVNLAVWIVMSITDRDSKIVVHTRL